jgi:hypothetical protein
MDLLLLTAIVMLLLLVLTVAALARWAWRLFRYNEEPIAGGSMSRQMFGRSRDKAKRGS